MKLPPLPNYLDCPTVYEWDASHKEYGELCVKYVCGQRKTTTKKFDAETVIKIRRLIGSGYRYKNVNKVFKMSERTFYNIKHHLRAYI